MRFTWWLAFKVPGTLPKRKSARTRCWKTMCACCYRDSGAWIASGLNLPGGPFIQNTGRPRCATAALHQKRGVDGCL